MKRQRRNLGEGKMLMKESDQMPGVRDMASEEVLMKARERGTRLGFKGIFLDHFIENELRIKKKRDKPKRGEANAPEPNSLPQ